MEVKYSSTTSTNDTSSPNEFISQSIDMISGFIAAINGRFVCYPLETLKTLSQVAKLESMNNKTTKISPLHVCREAISEGGILRLYRGITPSLIGGCIASMVQFWLFGVAERQFQLFLNKKELSIFEIGYCGAITGCGLAFFLTPC